jgi:TolA-binding protein
MLKHSVISALLLLSAMAANAAVEKKLSVFPEGERLIYGRVVESYRRNDLTQMLQQRSLLERNYPSSVHLDNAFYLSGMLQFQNSRYGEAVRDFNVVTDKYPKSNKRPSALFAMAMTYERLGLQPQAQRVMGTLIKEYPGSQESQRAWMHLQVEKSAKRK